MIHVEQFKDYYLTRRIGLGGMAEIFRGRKVGEGGFEKLVVVKRLLPHLAGNDEFRAMFLDEARLASQLSHPNIVHVYDLGRCDHPRNDSAYFIAMEHVFGKNLAEVRKQAVEKKFFPSLEHIVRVVVGAALALHYAHFKKDDFGESLNVVHRDVSPQNILLSYEGEVKLADFGIAKALTRTQHTQSGVLKGKLAYMAPEHARGETIDYRSDIYSLGVVFWELLTGRRLFSGDSEATTLRNVLEPKIDAPTSIAPHVPRELENACLRCLALDPAQRYQDAKALTLYLEQYLRDAPLTTGPHSLRDYMHGLYDQTIDRETREIQEEALAVRSLILGSGEETQDLTQAVDSAGMARPGQSPVGKRDKGDDRSKRLKIAAAGLATVMILAGGAYWGMQRDTLPEQAQQARPVPVDAPDLGEQPHVAKAEDAAQTDLTDDRAAQDGHVQDIEAIRQSVQEALLLGDRVQALALLDAAEDSTPWSVAELVPLRALVLRDNALALLESDPGLALQQLQQIALYYQDDAQVHLAIGRVLTRLGQPENALAAYDQALAVDNALHEVHYNRGVLLLRLGRVAAAEDSFQNVLALNPPYVADVYVNLAACKAQQGLMDEATNYLHKALTADPDHELAKHNLRLLTP